MSETRKDFIASVIFFFMGIGVNVSTLMIKDPGLSEMGPREFPRFIGICMMVLSMALFLKTVYVYKKRKKADLQEEAACGKREGRITGRDEARALAIAGICLLYAVTFTVLGYFISTFLAITLICVLFREKRLWVYPLLYGSALVIWLGFTFLLSIRLP